MGDLHRIIDNFRRTPRYARLYINDSPSPIEINYMNEQIEISNLQEFYKHVRIPIPDNPKTYMRPHFLTSSASADLEHWEILDEEESQWMQIYRMWDPVFFLSRLEETQIEFPKEVNHLYTINGSYSILESESLPLIKEFFMKYSETTRRFRIHLFNHEVLALIQKDLPPFQDTITLEFFIPTTNEDIS